MKVKTGNRVLALLMSVMMVFCFMPSITFAADSHSAADAAAVNAAIASAENGQVIKTENDITGADLVPEEKNVTNDQKRKTVTAPVPVKAPANAPSGDVSGSTEEDAVEGNSIVDTDVASIGETGYATLQEAVNAAKDGETVKLVKNAEITQTISVFDSRKITIDLAGSKVKSNLGTTFKLTKGQIVVADSVGTGVIDVDGEAFRLDGVGNNNAADAVLDIQKGVTIVSGTDCCVFIRGKATVNTAGELTSHGSYATIQSNGSANQAGTVVNVTGGSVVNDYTENGAGKGHAIYQPAIDGVTTISGGNISGSTVGVEVRGGTLTISGGTITGGSGKTSIASNGNGTTAENVAVAVSQHSTKDDIKVEIAGGTFDATTAFAEASPETSDEVTNVEVNITNGRFNGAVTAEDVNHFVKGGSFTEAVPSEYITEGSKIVKNGDGNYDVVATCTVTFVFGNSMDDKVVTLPINTKVEKPADPERTGYTFCGWLNGEEVFDFDSPVKKDITLKAKWTAAVAKDDKGNLYATLPEAVKATKSGTVTLLADASGAGIFVAKSEEKDITIDLGGHTYTVSGRAVGSTGTETQGLHLEKGNKITLKNGTVTSTEDSEVKMLVQNYSDLTLEDVILDGSNLSGKKPYTLSNNCGDVVIGKGATVTAKEGGVAFDVCATSYYPEGVTVTVLDGATINGDIEYDIWGEKPESNQAKLEVRGGTVNGTIAVEKALAKDAEKNLKIEGGEFKDAEGNKYAVPEDKILDKAEGEKMYTLKDAVKVTFDADGGEPAPEVQKIVKGGKVSEPAAPAKEDNIFGGWTLDGKAFDFSTATDKSITLKAKWNELFDITFDANGGKGEMKSVEKAEGSKYKLPESGFDPSEECVKFEGWLIGEETKAKAPETEITITGDTVIKASWTSIHKLIHHDEITARCTADGQIEHWNCSVCGKYFSDADGQNLISKENTIVKATGHDWNEWTIVMPATCTESGLQVHDCKNDPSHKDYEIIKPTGHKLTKVNAKEATCEDAGNTEHYTCENCGKFFSDAEGKNEISKADTVVAAKGHAWDEGKVTTEATCEVDGVKTFTCTNDPSHTKTEAITAIGHKWSGWKAVKEATCSEKGIEERICENDASHKETRESSVDLSKHDWNEWTIVMPATCTESGLQVHDCKNDPSHKDYEIIKPTGHKLTKVNAKEATCEDAGNTEYYTCENCGKFFSDVDGKTEITKTETVAVAKGHEWDEGIVTKEPTTEEEGVKTFTCKNDPAHTKTEPIPKLETEKKPEPDNTADQDKKPETQNQDPGNTTDQGNQSGQQNEDLEQMSSDVTAVGPGVSASIAEKAITSMKNDNDPAGSSFSKLRLRSPRQAKKAVKLSWSKVPGAAKYVLYGNQCGSKNKMKKIATLKKNSLNVKKAVKKLKKGTYYKFLIVAIDNNDNVVSTSKVIHVATKGSRKAANPKKVIVKAKVNKKGKKLKKYKATGAIALRAGKTTKLKANITKPKKSKVRKHVNPRYESANTKIATVTSKGKVRGVKKGKTTIYVYAQNGIFKAVKVRVK